MYSNNETNENIYTVSRLNSEVRFILEDTFPFVWVEGEISNFAAPNSGHWYFCVKDPSAQVKCAMFRSSQRKMTFKPKDGMQVLLKARVSLYENTGSYQLIVEEMEERGEGQLKRAFEMLKKKLEAAGLFDIAHKKPFPLFPKQIGVITSPTGAAIRDVLTVLKRRFPSVPVIIYPTLVQGATAAPTIVKAIQTANLRQECDVLILARGGGSLEDLWPFNEEIVAHAIYQSEIPVISGVGHEVDFTIADFVADQRAPTPSAAAAMIVPDKMELLPTLARSYQQLNRLIQVKLRTLLQQIHWQQKHLAQQHPKRRLTEKMQRLDFYELALIQIQSKLLNQIQHKLRDLNLRLHHLSPAPKLHAMQNQVHLIAQRLNTLMLTSINKKELMLANAAATLDTLSPLATLKRGYAIVSKKQQVLHDVKNVQIGDLIDVKLGKGKLACTVDQIEDT